MDLCSKHSPFLFALPDLKIRCFSVLDLNAARLNYFYNLKDNSAEVSTLLWKLHDGEFEKSQVLSILPLTLFKE